MIYGRYIESMSLDQAPSKSQIEPNKGRITVVGSEHVYQQNEDGHQTRDGGGGDAITQLEDGFGHVTASRSVCSRGEKTNEQNDDKFIGDS